MEIKTLHAELDRNGKLRAVRVDNERFPGALDDTSNQMPEALEVLKYLAGQGFEVANDMTAGRRVIYTMRRDDTRPKNTYERLQAWARGETITEPDAAPAAVVDRKLTAL